MCNCVRMELIRSLKNNCCTFVSLCVFWGKGTCQNYWLAIFYVWVLNIFQDIEQEEYQHLVLYIWWRTVAIIRFGNQAWFFDVFSFFHFYGREMICNSVLVLMWWCMAAIRSFRNQVRFGSSTCTIWLLSEIWEVVWHFYQRIFSDALCLNHQWCIS